MSIAILGATSFAEPSTLPPHRIKVKGKRLSKLIDTSFPKEAFRRTYKRTNRIPSTHPLGPAPLDDHPNFPTAQPIPTSIIKDAPQAQPIHDRSISEESPQFPQIRRLFPDPFPRRPDGLPTAPQSRIHQDLRTRRFLPFILRWQDQEGWEVLLHPEPEQLGRFRLAS
jgi:hypothetical protein